MLILKLNQQSNNSYLLDFLFFLPSKVAFLHDSFFCLNTFLYSFIERNSMVGMYLAICIFFL